jgi:sugar phosphate permease
MSLLSGYLAANLGWRMMFVVEGLPPVLWALVWWRLVADRPRDVAWLAAADRDVLEAKLAEEQRTIAPVRNYAAAFRSPRVIILAVQYFLWSIGVYGFVIWLPSMLKTSNMGMVELGWLSATPFAAAAIMEFSLSAWSDKSGKRIALVWPCLVIASAAFYGSYLLGGTHFWASFVLLVIAGAMMYAPYGPYFAFLTESLPSNVAGGAIALINSVGALGSFVGAYGVGMLNGMTGSSAMSYLLMAAALIVSALLTYLAPKTSSS